MPIARKVTYKCKKCGYTFSRMVGDVITPMDIPIVIEKKCPKCGGELKVCSELPFGNDNIINKIINIIKGC